MAMRFGMESLFGKKQTRNALAAPPAMRMTIPFTMMLCYLKSRE